MRKILLYPILLLMALLISLPLCLYGIGLYGVEGRPIVPLISATGSEKEKVKLFLRVKEEVKVIPINPYEYTFKILSGGNFDSGIAAAWVVSANHNLGHLKYKGNRWWQLSGAALTIWVSRNWTTDQVMSKIVEIRNNENS